MFITRMCSVLASYVVTLFLLYYIVSPYTGVQRPSNSTPAMTGQQNLSDVLL